MKLSLDFERKENSDLRQIAQSQERDLNLIRQTILAKSKQNVITAQQSPSHRHHGSLPVAVDQNLVTARHVQSPNQNDVIVAVGKTMTLRHVPVNGLDQTSPATNSGFQSPEAVPGVARKSSVCYFVYAYCHKH